MPRCRTCSRITEHISGDHSCLLLGVFGVVFRVALSCIPSRTPGSGWLLHTVCQAGVPFPAAAIPSGAAPVGPSSLRTAPQRTSITVSHLSHYPPSCQWHGNGTISRSELPQVWSWQGRSASLTSAEMSCPQLPLPGVTVPLSVSTKDCSELENRLVQKCKHAEP